MKQHFFMPYFGNKRQEVKEIFNIVEPDLKNINTIVEPYCGSCALSFYISTLYPKRFQYILNDNNVHLINIFKILQDDEKADKFYNDLNLLLDGIDKEKYNAIVKDAKNDTLKWFFINKYYNIRPGLYPTTKGRVKDFRTIKECKFINFLKTENIKIYCNDAINILNDYGDNENNLIFLDPPYLASCNDYYNNKDVNIYQHLFNNNISTFKSFIIICLEDMWIVRLLFKDDIKSKYEKKYENSKKKTHHIIITNKTPLNIVI